MTLDSICNSCDVLLYTLFTLLCIVRGSVIIEKSLHTAANFKLHTPYYYILLHTTYNCILHSTMTSYCDFTRSAIPMHSNGSKHCSSPHAMCVCPVSRGGLATLCREHTGDRILMAVFTLPNRVLAVFTFQGPGCACAPKNRSWLCLFSLEFVLCRC